MINQKNFMRRAKRENSIEKDEEILNNIKTYMQENIDKGWHKFVYNDLGCHEKCIDIINAIEHILSEYKRVLKENEELNYKLHSKKIALEIYNRYIPKSKLKEKKEELDKEEKRELKGTKGQDRYYIKQKYMYKRKVLQELLEESEE